MEYFLVFLPLIGSFIAGFFGRFLPQRLSEIITSLCVLTATFFSILVLITFLVPSVEKSSTITICFFKFLRLKILATIFSIVCNSLYTGIIIDIFKILFY